MSQFVPFTARQCRVIIAAARRNFDYHIRIARYETAQSSIHGFGAKYVYQELAQAAKDRQLIAYTKVQLTEAIAREAREYRDWELNISHDMR